MKQIIYTLLFLGAFSVNLSAQDVKPTSYKQCPDNNHPHLIDLGLPSGTKWACCNVDAFSPRESGGFYAWGETEEKFDYSWNNYKYCDNTTCFDLGSSICGTQYDVVHVKWRGSWLLPIKEQFQELIDNCKYEWTTFKSRKGGRFTGPNGGSIFLPAAGERRSRAHNSRGQWGGYWAGTISSPYFADGLSFSSDHVGGAIHNRINGYSVRPVTK